MAQSLEDVFREIKAQMLACRGTKKAMKQERSLVQYDAKKTAAAAAETPAEEPHRAPIADRVVAAAAVSPSKEQGACRAGTQVSAGRSTQRNNSSSPCPAAAAAATSRRWQDACRGWQEHSGANTKKTHSVSLQIDPFF